MTAVYVVTTTPFVSSALPQVFKEIEGSTGAKEFIRREWGEGLRRVSPSRWELLGDDHLVKIDKRALL